MILCGSEQSDGDSTGRSRERKGNLKVEPPLRLSFLKAKCLSTGKPGDNTLIYFNKNRVPRNTPSPDQRAEHLYAGDGLTLIIKNVN